MKIFVIRTDGTEEQKELQAPLDYRAIEACIGAGSLDIVNLRDGRFMYVDDNGYETEPEVIGNVMHLKCVKANKPVNEKATKLYHAVCLPGTTHQIVGDVAIIYESEYDDEDE